MASDRIGEMQDRCRVIVDPETGARRDTATTPSRDRLIMRDWAYGFVNHHLAGTAR